MNKRYGHIVAVKDVDIEAYPGEVMGIVGESGSGKSTVLRMLNLEENADSGSYFLDVPKLENQDLFQLDRFAKREAQIFNIGGISEPASGSQNAFYQQRQCG